MSAILPDAEWRRDPALLAVIAALPEARFVGGAVRDTLLSLPVSDVDLATPLPPQEVIARLKDAGLKAVPTGLDHGTVTAVSAGRPFEVTTLRRDVSTDGRRATVAFSTDWREDAARRDFTMNALYADPATGEIFDWFGGVDDLHAHRLRFIGDAGQRIAEDHLRILRYFRFLARFGEGDVDGEALAACEAAATSLMALSRERVASELTRLLATADPLRAVTLMARHGIFAAFLPELDPAAPDRLAALLAIEALVGAPPAALRRMLAILPVDTAVVDRVAARLRLSNADRTGLAARLAAMAMAEARPAAYAHGLDAARDAALLTDRPDWWAALADFTVPRLPLSGRDLIARGLQPGPVVARTLGEVERAWVAEGFPDAARLAEIADQRVAAAMKL